jgi:hypothetical protein
MTRCRGNSHLFLRIILGFTARPYVCHIDGVGYPTRDFQCLEQTTRPTLAPGTSARSLRYFGETREGRGEEWLRPSSALLLYDYMKKKSGYGHLYESWKVGNEMVTAITMGFSCCRCTPVGLQALIVDK